MKEKEPRDRTNSKSTRTIGGPSTQTYKVRKNSCCCFRPRAGENASASEVDRTELQKYELEELLGLESKQLLLWWKEHKSLYKYLSLLSKKNLCIMATSVPSERLFIVVGNLVAEKRSLSNV